ncbi:MAG: hypothetical protein ACREDS_02615 [Limisphaerales bacterium]
MKKSLLSLVIQMICVAGFPQSLPLNGGIHFQRTNLVVRWKAPKHPWPKTLGVYQMVPTKYSPTVISNLMALGPFTDKDKTDRGTNGMSFSNTGGHLEISFTMGEIEYARHTRDYSPTDLAQGVPPTNQLFQLTTNFLPKLGISLSEISKGINGRTKINAFEPFMEYFRNGVGVTNIEWRGVGFRRAVDGVEFFYDDGHGGIDFGEHSQVVKIILSWPDLKRDNFYSAAPPKKIIQWICEGRARQKHMLRLDGGETMIDWATVKSLTITKATAYYHGELSHGEYATNSVFANCVWPYADLWGMVDTGTTNVEVAIDCPIVDETKPLKTE